MKNHHFSVQAVRHFPKLRSYALQHAASLGLGFFMALQMNGWASAQGAAGPPAVGRESGPTAGGAENPSSVVPPTRYKSVFAHTPRGVETQTTPWREANDLVGRFLRGHLDILKWEEQEAIKSNVSQATKLEGDRRDSAPSTRTGPASPVNPKPPASSAHKH